MLRLPCCKDVRLKCEVHRFDPGKRVCRCGQVMIPDPVVRAHWKQFQRRPTPSASVLVVEYEEQVQDPLEDFA